MRLEPALSEVEGVGILTLTYTPKKAPHPEVTPVTAPSTESSHNRFMERTVNEAEYVLAVLRRMRVTVSANPESFDPDAQQRIDEAISCTQAVLRSAQAQLTAYRVEQESVAA